jgi:hypothetical protein
MSDVVNPGGGALCTVFLQHNGAKKHIATVVLDYS